MLLFVLLLSFPPPLTSNSGIPRAFYQDDAAVTSKAQMAGNKAGLGGGGKDGEALAALVEEEEIKPEDVRGVITGGRGVRSLMLGLGAPTKIGPK